MSCLEVCKGNRRVPSISAGLFRRGRLTVVAAVAASHKFSHWIARARPRHYMVQRQFRTRKYAHADWQVLRSSAEYSSAKCPALLRNMPVRSSGSRTAPYARAPQSHFRVIISSPAPRLQHQDHSAPHGSHWIAHTSRSAQHWFLH